MFLGLFNYLRVTELSLFEQKQCLSMYLCMSLQLEISWLVKYLESLGTLTFSLNCVEAILLLFQCSNDFLNLKSVQSAFFFFAYAALLLLLVGLLASVV